MALSLRGMRHIVVSGGDELAELGLAFLGNTSRHGDHKLVPEVL